MATPRTERRRAQRVDARLKLEIRLPREDGSLAPTTLETLNISTSGVYFQADHFIEPMTKLDLELELPVPARAGDGAGVASCHCEGIVVRVIPEEPAPPPARYEVAVFFTHFDPEALEALEDHIQMLLAAS